MPLTLPKRRLASLAARRANLANILHIFESLNPDPRCELFFKTPYQLLVSVVLSAQATDKSVNACMQPVYEKGFDAHDAVALGDAKFQQIIKSVGLSQTKSKNVISLSRILLESYSGQVPNKREALEALPGVGRKTANVVLGELFREPTLAVDTHVFRVSARLGLQNATTPQGAEEELLKLIDPVWLPRAHHWFVLHGRYICKAAKPQCPDCPIRQFCPSAEIFFPKK